jgi:hypothetical protein
MEPRSDETPLGGYGNSTADPVLSRRDNPGLEDGIPLGLREACKKFDAPDAIRTPKGRGRALSTGLHVLHQFL